MSVSMRTVCLNVLEPGLKMLRREEKQVTLSVNPQTLGLWGGWFVGVKMGCEDGKGRRAWIKTEIIAQR